MLTRKEENLVKLVIEMCDTIDKLDDLEFMGKKLLNEDLFGNMLSNMWDKLLEIIGVPKDSVEGIDNNNPTFFCRDWLYNIIFDEHKTSDEKYQFLMKEITEYV